MPAAEGQHRCRIDSRYGSSIGHERNKSHVSWSCEVDETNSFNADSTSARVKREWACPVREFAHTKNARTSAMISPIETKRLTDLTRIRLHLQSYFCLHRCSLPKNTTERQWQLWGKNPWPEISVKNYMSYQTIYSRTFSVFSCRK